MVATMLNPRGDVVISVSSRRKFALSKHSRQKSLGRVRSAWMGTILADDPAGSRGHPLASNYFVSTLGRGTLLSPRLLLNLLVRGRRRNRRGVGIIKSVLRELGRSFSISIFQNAPPFARNFTNARRRETPGGGGMRSDS